MYKRLFENKSKMESIYPLLFKMYRDVIYTKQRDTITINKDYIIDNVTQFLYYKGKKIASLNRKDDDFAYVNKIRSYIIKNEK